LLPRIERAGLRVAIKRRLASSLSLTRPRRRASRSRPAAWLRIPPTNEIDSFIAPSQPQLAGGRANFVAFVEMQLSLDRVGAIT
jgi:hypothetical protein